MQRTLRSFDVWKSEVESWASPDCTIPLLGVYGTQGLTKTYTLESALGKRAKTIRCHGTPIELVRKIHDANASNLIPLFDDVDSLLKDLKALNILKAALDSEGRIQWSSNTNLLTEEQKDFRVKVRVAVISNDPLIFSKHLRAVGDRGVVYHLAPDAYEVHQHVGEWWPRIVAPALATPALETPALATPGQAIATDRCPAYDDEVYQHLGSILDLISIPTVRAYTNSALMKRSGMDWKTAIEDTFCLDADRQLVRHLMLDVAYLPEERACEFIKRAQKSRATYFRYQSEIGERLGIKPVATDDRLHRERIVAGQRPYIPPGFEPPRGAREEAPVLALHEATRDVRGEATTKAARVEFPGKAANKKSRPKKSG